MSAIVAQIVASPVFWPAFIAGVAGIITALVSLSGKLTETHVGSETEFRKMLLARIQALEAANDEHDKLMIEKVQEIAGLKTANALLEAKVTEHENTIESLRRRPVGGEPLDRREAPIRLPMPHEPTIGHEEG